MSNPASVIPNKTPATVLTYGPSKLGKTTDNIYSFPRALFIAHPAALKPSEAIVGFPLSPGQVFSGARRISDATKLLKKLGSEFDGAVVDDFSLIVDQTLAVLEASGKSGFKLWGALREEIIEFRDEARACGKHVLVNCHEAPPKQKNGGLVRGGPKLPSDLAEQMPVHFDLVLRAFPEPTRRGAWQAVYRCGPQDPMYITGDRHGVAFDMCPMNVGEILKLAGYPLRRAPGLEWMDEIVPQIAQAALQTDPMMHGQLAQQIAAHIQQKYTQNLLHIRWVLRDGFDRATFIRQKQNVLNGFF